uniref:Protein kinase domain-containing protein n=1 Tax=Panagrolaimus davidi TaxID=227884 RepID=A0A914P9S2_9BILA
MQGKLCKANGVKEDEIGVALKMPSKLATELEKKQFLNEVNLVNSDKSVSTKKDFFRFLWQISHGLQYLAEKSIVHRDLAARNILIDLQNNAKVFKI